MTMIHKYYSLKYDTQVMAISPEVTFNGTDIMFTESNNEFIVPEGTIVRVISYIRKVNPILPHQILDPNLKWENTVECVDIKTNYKYSFGFLGKIEDTLVPVPEKTIKVLYGG